MSKSERISIVTAANDDYVLPLAVMLRTLSNSASEDALLDVRVLTTGLSSGSWYRLEHSLAGTKLVLREVVIDPSALHGVKVSGHVSIETYFRLLAPSVLGDLGKVLYLDADLVVRHPIAGLYRQQLEGAHLLAVPNACKLSAYFSSERGVPSYSRLGIPDTTRTFNAGVMILDLERWRETNTTRAILEYLISYSAEVLWWDQDGLNAILHAHWRPLPWKWNVMTNHFGRMRDWHDSVLDAATFEAVKQDPGIVHYSSPSKPWKPDYSGPFLQHWQAAFAAVRPYFGQGHRSGIEPCQQSQIS